MTVKKRKAGAKARSSKLESNVKNTTDNESISNVVKENGKKPASREEKPKGSKFDLVSTKKFIFGEYNVQLSILDC